MIWLNILIAAAAGYLLGNLNGALLISKYVLKGDVREHGSGNAGLTNFLRSYGGTQTLIVLAIDVLKTVASCMLGGALLRNFGMYEVGKMVGGAFAAAGHMFPALFQFRGGKGILCSATLAAIMDWYAFAVVVGIFLIVLLLTRYVSLGSCLGAAAYPFAFAWRFWGNWVIVLIALILAISTLYMHRENFRRLRNGTESKLTFHCQPK